MILRTNVTCNRETFLLSEMVFLLFTKQSRLQSTKKNGKNKQLTTKPLYTKVDGGCRSISMACRKYNTGFHEMMTILTMLVLKRVVSLFRINNISFILNLTTAARCLWQLYRKHFRRVPVAVCCFGAKHPSLLLEPTFKVHISAENSGLILILEHILFLEKLISQKISDFY